MAESKTIPLACVSATCYATRRGVRGEVAYITTSPGFP